MAETAKGIRPCSPFVDLGALLPRVVGVTDGEKLLAELSAAYPDAGEASAELLKAHLALVFPDGVEVHVGPWCAHAWDEGRFGFTRVASVTLSVEQTLEAPRVLQVFNEHGYRDLPEWEQGTKFQSVRWTDGACVCVRLHQGFIWDPGQGK